MAKVECTSLWPTFHGSQPSHIPSQGKLWNPVSHAWMQRLQWKSSQSLLQSFIHSLLQSLSARERGEEVRVKGGTLPGDHKAGKRQVGHPFPPCCRDEDMLTAPTRATCNRASWESLNIDKENLHTAHKVKCIFNERSHKFKKKIVRSLEYNQKRSNNPENPQKRFSRLVWGRDLLSPVTSFSITPWKSWDSWKQGHTASSTGHPASLRAPYISHYRPTLCFILQYRKNAVESDVRIRMSVACQNVSDSMPDLLMSSIITYICLKISPKGNGNSICNNPDWGKKI